jgi:hypothetical protein
MIGALIILTIYLVGMYYESKIVKQLNYVRTGDDYALNLQHVKWIRKTENCFHFCILNDDCYDFQKYNVCKNNKNYERLQEIYNNI